MPKKRIETDRGIVRVTFELPADVKAQTVHLVGDFTSWKGIPMERGKDGGWRTSVDLEPGRSFEFRYLVDGERWENDWAADRYVRNPFGHENSVVETPALPARSAASAPSAGAKPSRKPAAAKKAVKKKAPAKKAAVRKAAAKKSAAKKTAAKKTAEKKTAEKKTGKAKDGGGKA